MMRALLPHEEGWDPSASRRGSVSSVYSHDPFEYQVRSGSPVEYVGSRGGGPGVYMGGVPVGEVAYSNLRRVMPVDGGYVERREAERLRDETSSSEESDEGSGVRVVPERVVREKEVAPAKKGKKKKR